MLEWWRRWRRKRLAASRKARLREAKGATELREFVYLDSTSVHSLVASRLGPIATEQTENEAREWESKAAGKVGADLAAFDLGASAETLRGGSQSIQVLKKSIVQTTFKDLLELEGDTLLLGGREKRTSQKMAPLSANKLVRGSLIELEVELDVEPVFRMATVISSLIGFVDRSPDLLDQVTRKQFAEGRAIEGLLRGLLDGLVPIRARVLDHRIVRSGDSLSIVPGRASPQNADEALCLVGVAEERLFWKDIRRVLFSRSRYRVLARIAEDGIRDSWTPIKLGHILEQIVPGFSAQMASEDWDTLIAKNSAQTAPRSEPLLKEALLRFIELVSQRMDQSCSTEHIENARSCIQLLGDAPLETETYRSESLAVFDLLDPDHTSGLTRDDLATLREQARVPAQLPVAVVDESNTPNEVGKPRHFLDCEFVAIYW